MLPHPLCEELLRFFDYEHGAESIRTYCSGPMYGVLQTERYARAVIETGAPNVRLAEVDRRVQARMVRQRRLDMPDPPAPARGDERGRVAPAVGGPEVLAEERRTRRRRTHHQAPPGATR